MSVPRTNKKSEPLTEPLTHPTAHAATSRSHLTQPCTPRRQGPHAASAGSGGGLLERPPDGTPFWRYLIAAEMFHWLALNLSGALSFRSSHVSLSTWVSRRASLSRSLRGSQTNYAPTTTAALLLPLRLTTECHASEICAQAGLARLAKWHQSRRTYRVL